MTDRELMQMAIDALEQPSPIGGFNNQEYVAKALRDRLAQPEYEFECPRCGHCCQQPEWVGLTDEEAWECWPQTKCWDWEDFQSTWKSMEAKLKEKNT